MAYCVVAARTHHATCVPVWNIAINGLRDQGMTSSAGIFRNVQIEPRDLNVVGIPPTGKVEGMQEAVYCFYRVFTSEVVRRVTVIAGCSHPMAGFQPSVVLPAHGVAVRARRRVVQQIRIPFGVQKCIGTQTDERPKKGCGREPRIEVRLHDENDGTDKGNGIVRDVSKFTEFRPGFTLVVLPLAVGNDRSSRVRAQLANNLYNTLNGRAGV